MKRIYSTFTENSFFSAIRFCRRFMLSRQRFVKQFISGSISKFRLLSFGMEESIAQKSNSNDVVEQAKYNEQYSIEK